LVSFRGRDCARRRADHALRLPLRFDALSVAHLLRTGWYLAGNRMGIGSAAAGLFHFATGLPWGLKLRLTKPPRFAPAVTAPPPAPVQPTPA
jgi:hypothetical protein